MQNRELLLSLLILVACVTGCTTRSISDSGYESGYGSHKSRGNPLYQGELSEFDVLGVSPSETVSQADIADALDQARQGITLRKGDSLMLIQSGAMMPDNGMQDALERYFSVTPFSGIPQQSAENKPGYALSLRYAAARAGIEYLVVYWGVLESGVQNLETKTISWVPIVGLVIPDEKQQMRIRLKIAVVDVRSGRWEVFTPQSFDNTAYSTWGRRESSDQNQVARLKAQAYSSAADMFIKRFVR